MNHRLPANRPAHSDRPFPSHLAPEYRFDQRQFWDLWSAGHRCLQSDRRQTACPLPRVAEEDLDDWTAVQNPAIDLEHRWLNLNPRFGRRSDC